MRCLLLRRKKIYFFIYEVTTWEKGKKSSVNHWRRELHLCVEIVHDSQSRLVYYVLGSSSLVAHVLHYRHPGKQCKDRAAAVLVTTRNSTGSSRSERKRDLKSRNQDSQNCAEAHADTWGGWTWASPVSGTGITGVCIAFYL